MDSGTYHSLFVCATLPWVHRPRAAFLATYCYDLYCQRVATKANRCVPRHIIAKRFGQMVHGRTDATR
eukprot:11362181-Karenia_brevis.AAC.1